MQLNFLSDIQKFLYKEFNTEVGNLEVTLCPPEFSADLTFSCFPLAKILHRSPMQLATKVGDFLSSHPDIEKVECIKAFVNITLKPKALFRDTVADPQKIQSEVMLPENQRRKILIEYSAPNTNKPQHLGHVRNNTIGMATASLLKRAGNHVTQINLVNDRGIHICKSMRAYQLFGNNTTPEDAGKKGDHFVGDFYVAYNKELKHQVASLKIEHPEYTEKTEDELFIKTKIGSETQHMLKAWESQDPAVRALWNKMNSWVFKGFAETYKRLGIHFDHTYLESQTYTLGKDIVHEGIKNGIFKLRKDGAAIIEFPDKNLGTKVVLRSDGTSVYVTQDIGTTLLKQRDYEPDQQIWVVGDEQKYHFQVLFAILKALGYTWANQLTHMAYGMVNLPSGKMKSREGTVVDADELFDEMEKLAKEATLQRNDDLSEEELNKRSKIISMAALKFMLLKVNPKTTIMFDPAAAIRFEGDTGPYILYAYARISSMLHKAAQQGLSADAPNWELMSSASEKKLAIRCAMYPDTIQKAAQELDSSVLSSYLLDLSKDFSNFYNKCSVLNIENKDLIKARLALCNAVRNILKDGLNTLTINTLENM